MKLTSYTDYALRTLIYLGMNRGRLVTIQDVCADRRPGAPDIIVSMICIIDFVSFRE
jgi:hypothetical protein